MMNVSYETIFISLYNYNEIIFKMQKVRHLLVADDFLQKNFFCKIIPEVAKKLQTWNHWVQFLLPRIVLG